MWVTGVLVGIDVPRRAPQYLKVMGDGRDGVQEGHRDIHNRKEEL